MTQAGDGLAEEGWTGGSTNGVSRGSNYFSSDSVTAAPSPDALAFLVKSIEQIGARLQFVQVSPHPETIPPAFFSIQPNFPPFVLLHYFF
jgi:hypothetical protein